MEEEIKKQEQEELRRKMTKEPTKNVQKIYIKDYGNLVLEIKKMNEIGIAAFSEKRNEDMFIPWTSIIFISRIDNGNT